MTTRTPAFLAISIASRVLWASVTLGLVALLSTENFAEFSVIQLGAALAGQMGFGVFSDIVGARIAESLERGGSIAWSALAYSGVVAGVLAVLVWGSGVVAGSSMVAEHAVLIALVAFGGFASALSTATLVACGRLRRAALQLGAQSALYVGLVLTIGHGSGADAALAAAVAQLVPVALLLVVRQGRGIDLAGSAREHLHALGFNAAHLAPALMVWAATLVLTRSAPAQELAAYGLAAQVANLFYFLPAALAPLVIARFSREGTTAVRREALQFVLFFGLLGCVAAASSLGAIGLLGDWLPDTVSASRVEIALGLVMAGVIAARCSFAWINQIRRLQFAEVGAGLATTLGLVGVFFVPDLSADALLGFRIAALVLALLFSIGMFLRVAERSASGLERRLA